MTKDEAILHYLEKEYPSAHCALHFTNDYECLVAILLSAQTTDRSVNKATPILFSHYPDFLSLSQASIEDIENDIHSLGLYHNKAISLQKLAQFVAFSLNNSLPEDRESLTKLPGVGIKTAGVFLLERRNFQAIPVDTHVGRIGTRLGFCLESDSVNEKEKKIERHFPKEKWNCLHHAFIEFGRDRCKAKNPRCEECEIKGYCSYFKKNSSIKGKKS